ncbi:MAG TPA: phosphoglucosamine mutase [Longimicrobiales bacterium]|nr:phosphoglucosamine mutase [Longimicrobiales bacterium]
MGFEVPEGLMVSVSGVRGRVGEALTPDVAARFAAAFGAYMNEHAGGRARVVLGRDSRTSGPMLARAVSAALEGVGCDVVEVGLVPTPTVLMAIRHHGADGGIVVTASHNPVEWNALKLASGEGMFLDAEEAAAMRRHLERPVPWKAWDGLGTVTRDTGAAERHVAAILDLPFVDVDAIRARRFRVALECIRGAGAVTLPPLLEALGCEVHGLNLEPDGRFPRKPEPVAENLGDLEALVQETGAHIGFATDPDADRLSLVDERGRAIGEDYTLALAARVVLRQRMGAVVTNLSTSRVVEDAARDAGAPFHRAPVGEINVARRMQKEGAVIGGEGNGGVILPELHHTRDAQVAAALVLQLLAETGRSVSEIVASSPGYAIVKDSIGRPAGDLEPAYARLERELGAETTDRQDGLWLGWSGKWLHFRPSGTEPIVRMIAEAPTEEEARALVDAARRSLTAD